jgi:hypothetical protein
MNPLNYHPFSGSYFRESYILSCSLIDSLSSLEIKLKSPELKENRIDTLRSKDTEILRTE